MKGIYQSYSSSCRRFPGNPHWYPSRVVFQTINWLVDMQLFEQEMLSTAATAYFLC